MGPVRRAVVELLEDALARGLTEPRADALAGVDPWIRRRAARRARRLHREADIATMSQDPTHVLRVALLLAHGRTPVVGEGEEAAALAAVEALPRVPPVLRGPWWSASALLLALVLALGGYAAWSGSQAFDARATPVGQLLGADVPQLFVDVSQGLDDAGTAARLVTVGRRAAAVLPANEQEPFHEWLIAGLAFRGAEADAKEPRRRWQRATNGLNQAWLARGAPWHLEIEVLSQDAGPTAVPSSFYVERVRRAVVDGQPEVVVHVWRLDDLNTDVAAFGYTAPGASDTVVSLDHVEAELITTLVPALVVHEPLRFGLGDEDPLEDLEVRELRELAGELLRAHFRAVPGVPPERLGELAHLLIERRRILRGWRDRLGKIDRILVEPERLIPEADYEADLAALVPAAERIEWDRVHRRLRSREVLDAFERLRDDMALQVERHELQHRANFRAYPLDADGWPVLPPGRSRADEEVSAFLAALASPETEPTNELVLLASFLLSPDGGGLYARVAGDTYLALADALGVDGADLVERGPRTARIGRVLRAVWGFPADDVRRAAAAAHVARFGVAPAAIELVGDTRAPRWRH